MDYNPTNVSESALQAAEALERCTNVFGSGDNLRYLADKVCGMHRTLQQSFVGGFVIPLIREMALRHGNGNYDLRNREAVKVCLAAWEAIKNLYCLGDDGEIALPMV